MLTISRRQLDALEEQQRTRFVAELVSLLEQRYPGVSGICSRQALAAAVAHLLQHACKLGFTYRDEVASYCLLCYHLGYRFEYDPQLPWISDDAGNPPVQRIHLLLEGAEHYTRLVLGAGNRHLLNAIDSWQFRSNLGLIEDAALPQSLTYLWPEKAEFIGHTAIVQLCQTAMADAKALGIHGGPPLNRYIECVFLLGLSCDSDPFFAEIRDAVFGAEALRSREWPGLLHSYAAAICRARTYSYSDGYADG